MGASSIEGGNVGGIPDRQQRTRTFRQFILESHHNHKPLEYFDPSEHVQEQTQAQARPGEVAPGTTRAATDSGVAGVGQDGQQVGLDAGNDFLVLFLYN
jgi:hypothetical protein